MTMVNLDEVLKKLEAIRTYEDVVPVIRCRDCVNCKETRDGSYLCEEWSDLTEPGAFCSFGKSVFDEKWSDLTEPGAFCSFGKSVFDNEEEI